MKHISVASPLFSGNELSYVSECIKTTWVSSGKYLKTFEKKFADYCKTTDATATSSGTTALHLLLASLGIKNGDEVIIPDLTYVSTANVVSYLGAKPVFVDVDDQIWNIDPKKIEEKINKRTKVIVAVHLYGHPSDMDEIVKIAKHHNIIVIEDACQALGSFYKGRPAGSLSDAGCFSFSGAKIITTGEGGMITTSNKKLIERIRLINSNFADKKRRFFHSEIGYNFRLTNIQAALGLAQLEKIKKLIRIKKKNAKEYSSLLSGIELIQLPAQKEWADNIYWLYSIVIKKKGIRDKLIQYLKEKGIETRQFFVPMHQLPMYKREEKYTNSEYLSQNGISLPSGLVLTQNEIEYICTQVKKFLRTHA